MSTHDGEYVIVDMREGYFFSGKIDKRYFKTIEEVADNILWLRNAGYARSSLTIFQIKHIPFEEPVITITTKEGKKLKKSKAKFF